MLHTLHQIFLQDMEQHNREGVLAGMLPEATARVLAVLPRAMAINALQTLIQPIAQQACPSSYSLNAQC